MDNDVVCVKASRNALRVSLPIPYFRSAHADVGGGKRAECVVIVVPESGVYVTVAKEEIVDVLSFDKVRRKTFFVGDEFVFFDFKVKVDTERLVLVYIEDAVLPSV
jgi:hypothetical protein